eukprot:TRINITY_DN56587_c0_g1_i1.p1 TRINITY_DN56587_c0_g1~~TRINITY_DN56587_c0_g1_i1.p1  ORF type:complete len:282 (+),score=21.48 TRINITY_DN56587_c0_g1_i1:44-847(+)
MGLIPSCLRSLFSGQKRLNVDVYSGYVEHAYRLAFAHEDNYADCSPKLLTILPSGVVETTRCLVPAKERGLMCYPYTQSILDDRAAHLLDIPEAAPFIFERPDGTLALVQTWSKTYNRSFRNEFSIMTSNPDSEKYCPRAVEEFRHTITKMFGPRAQEQPILYCYRMATNHNKVFVGMSEAIISYLRTHVEEMNDLGIESLIGNCAYKTSVVHGDGSRDAQVFSMAAGVKYALYKKVGWSRMACATPLEQFLKDRKLLARIVSYRSV